MGPYVLRDQTISVYIPSQCHSPVSYTHLDVYKRQIFGKVEALIYTIEFQKRGLPHAHILLSLNEQDEIVNATDIDKVVSAEIPNIQTHPTLHEYVVKHTWSMRCT